MPSEFTTLIGSAILLLSALGGAAGFFWKNRGDSIIKYQAIEIKNRDDKISDLEKVVMELRSENNILHEQNNKLSELAQGSPQLRELTKAISTLTATFETTMKKD